MKGIAQRESEATTDRRRLAMLIRSEYDYDRPRRDQVREAVVLAVGEKDLLVDLGAKRDGFVPPQDLELVDEAYLADLQVGDRIPVVIMKGRGPEGIRVSLNLGLKKQDWLRAQDFLDSGEIWEGKVTELNRGGVIVPFGQIRGFVPNSHLTSIPRNLRGSKLHDVKARLMGKTLSLLVIEVDQRRRRLILSQRMASNRLRQQLLKELREGDVRTGVVASIVDFGAFVDLNGMDGLIHISELDHQHVDHPSKVLNVGDEVEVYVLNIDRERKRIGLSRKRLMPNPWDVVTEELSVGQAVEGKVVSVVEFGAFVNLGKGIEGLVHVSNMPYEQFSLVELEVGSLVEVQVLSIDDDRRQIALKLQKILEPVSSEQALA
ncbi:MAG: S1 RNA-binding domain-containing protein [Anaerolineae bacterium]|nr:S1 RNA-binding domain-containing protein [Anaerolineae bacterium]